MDLQPERQNHSESTTQSGCLEREYAKDLLASLWLVNVDSKLLRYLHVLVMVKLFGWLCKAMTTAMTTKEHNERLGKISGDRGRDYPDWSVQDGCHRTSGQDKFTD